jgi:hypothetical protein
MKVPDDLTTQYDLDTRAVLMNRNDPDRVATRIGGLFTLYFRDGWEKRRQVVRVVEQFLQIPGCRIGHYASADGKRRPLKHLGKLPDQTLKTLEAPSGEDLYFSLYEDLGGDYVSTPLWETWGFAFGKDRPFRPLSGIHFHVPNALMLERTDELVAFILWAAEEIGSVHGTAGLGVLGPIGSERSTDVYWYPWLKTYQCLEYEASGLYWNAIEQGGYDVPRSSNWLTLLGGESLARLGGEPAIRDQLTTGMSFVPYKGGGMIRTSERPALGNTASGGIPEGYRTAARIIKPIRFEGYRHGIIKTPKEFGYSREQDLQVTLDWIRRFD